MKEIELKVAEALHDDLGRGIVRIESLSMMKLGISQGDVVELEGGRKTAAFAEPAYQGDLGFMIIRMDGIMRRNAKTGIGELVKIRKAEVEEAKKITVSPSRKSIMIKASPDLFKISIKGRPFVKGDVFTPGDDFAVPGGPMFGFGFGDLKFTVADTIPEKTVIVTDLTEIAYSPEAMEEKVSDKTEEYLLSSFAHFEDQISSALEEENLIQIKNEIKKVNVVVSREVLKKLRDIKKRFLSSADERIKEINEMKDAKDADVPKCD